MENSVDQGRAIRIIHAGHVRHQPGFVLKQRQVDRFVLFLFTAGTYRFLLDGAWMAPMQPGSGVLVRPNQVHGLQRGEDEVCSHFYVHFEAFGPIQALETDVLPSVFQSSKSWEVELAARLLVDNFQASTPDWGCEGLLLYLLSLLPVGDGPPQRNDRNQAAHRIADRLIRYLRENYHRPLTAEDLGRHMNLNPNYLATQFKKANGQTIVGFLMELRMARAKELLVTTDLPIARIAEAVGCEDARYFSRIFRRKEGMSPSEYFRRSLARSHSA